MHAEGVGDHIVAIIGSAGSGKSTFIEKASRGVHGAVHDGLESLTDDIQMVEATHPKDGHLVMFLDTPTFGEHSYSSTDVLYQISQWLRQQGIGDLKLSTIIYLHRISDTRMDGSLLKNLQIFAKLLGPKAMPNIVIATTMWSKVSYEEGKRREDDLRRLLQVMAANGCKIKRFDNTFESAWDIIGRNTSTTPLSLQKLSHQGWFRQTSRMVFGSSGTKYNGPAITFAHLYHAFH
ncbi:hypothetical protein PILCRDRAFT_13216 [Piloderma croceum F 1598]|uniref:G domain-containing protein n=1 Tax=Piloderma croceum (strain F 1598) TaxID=765440 RepID=A0A0C3APK3_PILCF|nr:hypothetical protein PILCRDRAFT_13216 [Piloderma croceum F 1598]